MESGSPLLVQLFNVNGFILIPFMVLVVTDRIIKLAFNPVLYNVAPEFIFVFDERNGLLKLNEPLLIVSATMMYGCPTVKGDVFVVASPATVPV